MPKITPVRKIRRLFWDIEVSHNVVLAFRAGFDQTINPESIIRERKIICIAFKWEGSNQVHVLSWDRNQDDRLMLKRFLAVANQADELVAHHGDKYDGPFFRTRCLAHGLEPLPPWKTVDTCAWARRFFEFNSCKLDYISKFLGYKGKTETDRQLWHDVLLKNCRKALARMCAYCKDDVRRLEEVYHRLKFCVKPKSHAGVMAGGEKWSSPRDGTTNVVKKMTRVTASGTITHQMQSKTDGSYFTISDSAYHEYLRAKKTQK